MQKPGIAPKEGDRLDSLRAMNVLDTPSEERFDRLTRIAKRLFDVPVALVSLIDKDRQWFKSCEGLNLREIPRDISFCGHTILSNDVLVVADTSQDGRFSDNPLVLNEPYIRFYAGAPLKSSDGHKVGTFCIMDRQPGSLSDEDLLALKDLISMAERELAGVQLATMDELTGITNRRGFKLLAQHSLQLFLREKIPASLVFFDLDNIRAINEEFGDDEGDKALKTFADVMSRVSRNSDLFARLGSDEFVVLLTHTPGNLAEDVVGRFRRALETSNRQAEREYDISFSYGIVELDPVRHPTVEALLYDKEAAMDQLKKAAPEDEVET